MVRWGPWARSKDEGKTLAIAFYKDGKEIKSYQVNDLVKDYRDLPQTVSHYMWRKETGFDDVGKRVRIQLHRGPRADDTGPTLIFSIPTGEYKRATPNQM
jgi:hypothetical protein